MNKGQVDDVSDLLQEMIVAQYRYNRETRGIVADAAWVDACERVDNALNNAVDAARANAMTELLLSNIVDTSKLP